MAVKNYTNKNTDLLELKKAIENYFRLQNYETQSKSSDSDHLVQARKRGTLRAIAGAQRSYDIIITKQTDGFSVSIDTGEWVTNLTAVGVGAVLTMGLSLLGSGPAAGWSKKIEADFIAWLDDTIRFGANSGDLKTPELPKAVPPKPNEQLEKLKWALDAGVLSETEFAEKVRLLKHQTEISAQWQKLTELFEAGLLTKEELAVKKEQLRSKLK
jgi:hypothetical protein